MTAAPLSRELIEALAGGVLPAGGEAPRVIETHISWVILAGSFAYKIKKPVRFGFVDFSSLAARREACREELRLNRRLTPELYLDVVAIYGTPDAPAFEPRGEVIEYAVRMRRFPAGSVIGEASLDGLQVQEIDELAELVGNFHSGLEPAAAQPWGEPARIWAPVAESLEQMQRLMRQDSAETELLARAELFLDASFHSSLPLQEERRRAGAVRECHGDLHLGNLVRIEGRIVPFDALEFDPALRWIDILSEVAFLVMDLETHGRRPLAFRFLNRYLDVTGDHTGLPVLPFYLAYRALVRAKVRALGPDAGADAARRRIMTLLAYAAAPLSGIAPALILMCGVSGSGKSWLAARIADALPAVHLRSDVERKRLFGIPALGRTTAGVAKGIYAPDASARTYERLVALAAATLRAELPVIIDATSLRREHRAPFLALARTAACPAAIIACEADDATIARRIRQREAAARDPSEASLEVVASQRSQYELPGPDEAGLVAHVSASDADAADRLVAALRRLGAQQSIVTGGSGGPSK